jgi:Arc/MetJ-type ribon-helix-helix transcriptional regulator
MQIQLTAEQREFVRRAVETGRVHREEDAVKQALDMWVERERQREEILAAIDEAEASVARGEVRIMPPGSARQLAEEVHQRGMARLAAAKKTKQR